MTTTTAGRTAALAAARPARLSTQTPRSTLVALGTAVALVALVAAGLLVGDFPIPAPQVLDALLGRSADGSAFIVTQLRLPRVLCALAVGAALGASGALFQSLTRNPLGSPDIMGFSTGAAAGGVAVIVGGSSTPATVAVGAVIGGAVSAAVVYVLARKDGSVSTYRLILVGIAASAMLLSLVTFLLSRVQLQLASTAQQWLIGSLNQRGWPQFWPLAVGLVALLPVAVVISRALRMVEMGDDLATAIGVRVGRTRRLAVVAGIGLSSAAVATAGPLVFVALAAPQIVARLARVSGPHPALAALTGAALVGASDLVATRAFAPTALPAGVATGAIGGLYLAWLLAGQWRKGRA